MKHLRIVFCNESSFSCCPAGTVEPVEPTEATEPPETEEPDEGNVVSHIT